MYTIRLLYSCTIVNKNGCILLTIMLVIFLHATHYYLFTNGPMYVVCVLFNEFSVLVRIVIHDIYYVHDSFIAFLYDS